MWLAPLTNQERAEVQARIDAQTHPEDQTAALDEWWRQFSARASDRSLVGAQPDHVSEVGALRQRAPETREETEA